MDEVEVYTVLLLVGPMVLQLAALLLLPPSRCSSKSFGEGGSGDDVATLLRTTPLSNATSSALLSVVPVGNSNTSSYLLIAPGYVYTVPTFG